MKMVKSLLLGSAAGLVAIAGAQAADLPVKAKPVEYVKICSLYGAGFYYIPGTDTCIRFSGFIRYEQNYNSFAAGSQDYSFAATPGTTGNIASLNWNRDFFVQRVRAAWITDTRTQTEWGTLRSFTYLYLTTWSGGSAAASGGATTPTLLQGYIQLAGFTVGRFKSPFYAPWSSNAGTYNGSLFYPDDAGASTGVMYTYQFGNGVSASIGVFDPGRAGTINTTTSTLTANPTAAMFTNSYTTGVHAPDISGNISVDQAWGTFRVGAVAHEITGTYYGATETTGHPNSKWGWGVNAGLNLKTLPTGAGDQIWLNVTYTDGFTRGQTNNSPATGIALYGPGSGAFYNSLGWTYVVDGVYNTNGQINTVRWLTAQGAFEHFWMPGKLKTSIYGYGGMIDFNDTSNALLCARFTAVGRGTTFNCDFDTKYWAVGSRTTWYPVKDLEVMFDVTYTQFLFGHSGFITANTTAANTGVIPGTKPGGVYDLSDKGVVSGSLRVVRSW